MLAPLTGGAGFIGQEQLSWAKLAVKTLPKTMGLKIKLVPGDAPVEQGPSAAQSVAQKFIADKNMVAILGGSTSGSVAATSKAFQQAGLVQVSSSATRTTLTKGDNQEATKAFFRVVPADDYQGPTDANYMIKTLKVKNVVLFDFQEPYSQGLSGEAEKVLKAAGVTTSHQSVPNTVTDFSSYVTKVPSDADIVFFPSQKPGDAQTFASQLAEQGKKAKVFGGDGTNDPSSFKAAGSYVSNFAPQITSIAADKAVIAAWKKDNPGKAVGSFGPPTYGAVQVILSALKKSCDAGKGSIAKRSAVITVHQEGQHQHGLDPGRQVRLVEGQHQRPEHEQVLHHADPAERLVQARQLGESTTTFVQRAVRLDAGPPSAFQADNCGAGATRAHGSRTPRLGAALWTPSRNSRSMA